MRNSFKLRLAGLVAVALMSTFSPAFAVSGGAPVSVGAYEFVAKVEVGTTRSCTGALIDPLWVITAGSCFAENTQAGPPALPATVTVGTISAPATDRQTRQITQVIPRADRNVALVRLASPVSAVPVNLATTGPQPGESLRIAGYGRTATEWVPTQLYTAPFFVGTTSATTFTVSSASASTCKGDSGGPAIREAGGVTTLVGMNHTSWQTGCLGETETRVGVTETRLDDLTVWLQQQMLELTASSAAEHSISLSWNALSSQNAVSYQVYGSTSSDFATGPSTLLGTATSPAFIHKALPAKQTWYYRVVPRDALGVEGIPSPTVSATTRVDTVTDFDGDGKDDIAAFTRGDTADVFVSLSNGQKFVQDAWRWHEYFAAGQEIPLSGDFDGDGKTDIITFTRGTSGLAIVSLSRGDQFSPTAEIWHSHFALGDEIPLVGDFNGDGMDDIATFTRGTTADVFVSLSNGKKFVQDSWKWHDSFAGGTEVPLVGDFDGDGKDDIACFTRGTTSDVFVSLSNGEKFVQNGWLWHDSFSVGAEIPAVGDFTGDGRDDIATFTRGDTADVFVSASDSGKFVQNGWKWHEKFALGSELPGVGDFDGDGKADIVTFTRGDTGDVYVSLSNGQKFVQEAWLWHGSFAFGTEVPLPARII